MKMQAYGRPFTQNLDHAVVCNATGKCTCERREIERRSADKKGNVAVWFDKIAIPRSITLHPGTPVDVPDSILRIPRVRRALNAGRIRAVR